MARLQNHFSEPNTNRVADAIFHYVEDEIKLKINNPIESKRAEEDIRLKLDYYSSIAKEYSRTRDKLEKRSLLYVRHEIRRLKGKLNPTLFNRVYYSDFSENIKSLLRGKRDPINYYQETIKQLDKELIQKHNLQSLTSQLKAAGFNVEIEGALKRMINQNLEHFHLRYADVENSKAHYVLHFSKIPNTELYYFQKFEAISRPSLDALLNNDVSCDRKTFYVHDDLKFNASEAANLVNGKSICKTVDGTDQWLMLDKVSMKRDQILTMEFNLEEFLMTLPIKERENQYKYQSIINALKSGSAKEVTLMINNEPMKFFLEVSPQNKAVFVLDKQHRLVDIGKLLTVPETTKAVFKKVNEQELDHDRKMVHRVG